MQLEKLRRPAYFCMTFWLWSSACLGERASSKAAAMACAMPDAPASFPRVVEAGDVGSPVLVIEEVQRNENIFVISLSITVLFPLETHVKFVDLVKSLLTNVDSQNTTVIHLSFSASGTTEKESYNFHNSSSLQ